jgi:hypothetical protein
METGLDGFYSVRDAIVPQNSGEKNHGLKPGLACLKAHAR